MRPLALFAPLVVALGLVGGCDRSGTTEPPPPVTSAPDHGDDATSATSRAPEGEPEPAARAVGLSSAQADRMARAIIAELAQTRELAAEGEFSVKLIDRAGVRSFVEKAMFEDLTPEELRLLGKIEASLGVLPPEVDPIAVLLDLYEEGVLGIYDPPSTTLLIGSFVPPSALEMVVGHELAHGLQDMHYDLEAMQAPLRLGPTSGRNDAETARTFLVEGDAQATYLAWRGGAAGPAAVSDEVLDVLADQALGIDERFTPYPTLARMMQMPYTEGTATVMRLARSRGWSAVDELYARLPETSEQMLHLDKLLRRELPRKVSLDHAQVAAALPDHAVVWEDDLGEAALLAMLVATDAPPDARDAAAGWDGDRFLALRPRDAGPDTVPTVVSLSLWDTEADARAFEASMRRYLGRSIGGAFAVARRKDRVLFTTFVPPTAAPDAVLAAGWAAARVEAAPKEKR